MKLTFEQIQFLFDEMDEGDVVNLIGEETVVAVINGEDHNKLVINEDGSLAE